MPTYIDPSLVILGGMFAGANNPILTASGMVGTGPMSGVSSSGGSIVDASSAVVAPAPPVPSRKVPAWVLVLVVGAVILIADKRS